MPTERDLTPQEESIKDQTAAAELEIKAEELKEEEAQEIAGGMGNGDW